MSELPSYPQDAAERETHRSMPGDERGYAGWGRRLAAYLLDVVIIGVPLIIVILVALIAASPDEDDGAWAVIGLAYLVTIVVPFFYFTFFHGAPRGQTPGKRMVGIRVVSDETGNRVGYARAFGRYVITVVFGFLLVPWLVDYLWPLWDRKNQALHDKIVGSVVVRD